LFVVAETIKDYNETQNLHYSILKFFGWVIFDLVRYDFVSCCWRRHFEGYL